MLYPLYTSHAHLWHLLSPIEGYESEMMEWVGLIEERKGVEWPDSLLDLGSGGGHHLYHLAQNFPQIKQGVAVDLSAPMLERVSELLPRFELLAQDMTTLRLSRRFSLITVHDSFCYLTNFGQVRDLFTTISAHLEPNGLALIKLDAVADTFVGPYRYLTDFEDDHRKVTLTHYEWDPVVDDESLEVLYHFIEQVGAEVTTREERHTLGLFSQQQLLSAAGQARLAGSFRSLERWDEERDNLVFLLEHQ